MSTISIIIPMYNEARHIERTLRAARLAADHAGIRCELLVMDNGSQDNGPALAAALGASVISYPGIVVGALRNRGMAAASGDYLAFLDADIEVPLDWLALSLDAIAHQQGDMVALSLTTPAAAPWFAHTWQARNHLTHVPVRDMQWLSVCNVVLKREWISKAGGFDEQLQSGEDKEFSLRLRKAGAKLICLTRPPALHWGYEGSWREWIGKELWRQGSNVQLLQQERQWRVLRFPLLSILCWLLTLYGVLGFIWGNTWSGLPALSMSLTLPLLLSLRQTRWHRDPLLTLRLWPLHWLRLHLAAVALLLGLIRYQARRPERG
ncbi:glycosyltransferase [Pokkaliibacter sp. MBI-7]|uniref:glycosyltransferase n=1 Tax=Pokkaliibacter sp. MBI-7 TaxID=3040600 RepID=UPI0024494CA6|nr:glycosyltransferase [Pokkaliibacter sp. MBI-7]MDH2432984.1 glycosyltransferase [Pokkaliibacter sp. MBI-7]